MITIDLENAGITKTTHALSRAHGSTLDGGCPKASLTQQMAALIENDGDQDHRSDGDVLPVRIEPSLVSDTRGALVGNLEHIDRVFAGRHEYESSLPQRRSLTL